MEANASKGQVTVKISKFVGIEIRKSGREHRRDIAPDLNFSLDSVV